MLDRKAIKRALEAAGFVFLRGGWVRRTDAPKLQDKIEKAVNDAADDVAKIKNVDPPPESRVHNAPKA
jgi:hypothetical protein